MSVEGHSSAEASHPSPGEPTAETLGRLASEVSWDKLKPHVQDRTKELLLDLIGVTVGGASSESTLKLKAYVQKASSQGSSTLIGHQGRVQPEWASLVNGAASHALEMDDCTRASSLHPGSTVVPSALAIAELVDATGIELCEAIVVGYEVVMRVGEALNPASTYARGFHPTGIAGVFGATAASGVLLGLTPSQMTSAFGVAGNLAAGSLEYLGQGTLTKRLTPGWAAHAGVVAARLGVEDYSGPATVFEGRAGVLRAYSDGSDWTPLIEPFDSDSPKILEVATKPYACCRYAHGVIDAVLDLRERHQLDPKQVERIRLGVLSIGENLVAAPIEQKRTPSSLVDAQFSAPYAAAIALLCGQAGPDQFSDRFLGDPEVTRLMALTDCYTSSELDRSYPSEMPSEAQIDLSDGTSVFSRIHFPLGEPENPVSRRQLTERFKTLSSRFLDESRADAAIEALLAVDELDSARSMTSLLRPSEKERLR